MAFLRIPRQVVYGLIVCGGCLSLSACASWFQQREEAPLPDAAIKALSYQAVLPFINTDQGREMLQTEPLRTRLTQLLGETHRAAFEASREVLLPVSQIMEGYVLSEGHNPENTLRSLVVVDPDRDLLTVVLLNAETLKYRVLQQGSQHPEATEAALEEMYQYADRWALGQLGMAD